MKLLLYFKINKDIWRECKEGLIYYLPLPILLWLILGGNLINGLDNFIVYFVYHIIEFILLILTTFSAIYFLCCMGAASAESIKKSNTNNHCYIKIGEPGNGKSASAIYETVIHAKRNWIELQLEYWSLKSQLGIYLKTKDYNGYHKYCEVASAYNFWKSSNRYPCLISNIPLKVGGLQVLELTREHINQQWRIPYMTILFIDEIGSLVFTDEADKNRPLRISHFFRWCRHFGKFMIVATEQDKSNVYIDIRRVVAYNEYMNKQQWICKPNLLLFLVDFLEASIFIFCIRKKDKMIYSDKLSSIYFLLNNFAHKIGFRQFEFSLEKNTEQQKQYKKGNGKYMYPSSLNAKYNDRTYLGLYLAKDKDYTEDVFNTMFIDINSLFGKSYMNNLKKFDGRETAKKCNK